MTKARLGAAGLGAAVALLFAACGNGPPAGSGGGGGNAGGGGGGGNVGSKVSGQTAATKFSESDALKFSPTSGTFKAGDVVEWDNTGSIAHNVTFDDFQSITSDTMNGGDTYQVKFTKAGTYQFHCTFHPGMEGTITVTG
jgi:plastocyanin